MVKLLFIDDDAVLCALVKRMLGPLCSLKVVSPEEAGSQIEAGDHDLIVSDLYMDVLTGLDVVKMARNRSDRQVPVILVTAGSGGDRLLQQAIAEGACGFIEKPFGDYKDFLARVIQLAGAERIG